DIALQPNVCAVQAGASCHEASAVFEVSPSSAIPWVARWRQTGSVAALIRGAAVFYTHQWVPIVAQPTGSLNSG
ncbi:MAG: hypothetical protein ACLPKT_17745, partial [Methylocella sp.]